MGKIIETTINRFDGGITNDPNDTANNVARIVSNFDIISRPHKMTPRRDSESGDNAATTSKKQNFCIALFNPNTTPDTYAIYALGIVNGQSYAEILYKNLTRNSTQDLTDNLWIATANNQSASGAINPNLFVFYRKTGYIYGARNGTHIFKYDPDGTDPFSDTHVSLGYTHIGQGIVHSKDDILYIPYYNENNSVAYIAKNNAGTWNGAALSLPSYYIPTSICEYGNYLAIGCADANGIGNSRVFLWDRNESTTTLAESIDWGTGSLMILQELDGELIGISQRGGTPTSFAGLPQQPNASSAGTVYHKDRVIFRRLVGNQTVKIFELEANQTDDSNYTRLPAYKQKIDNRLFFQMLISLNGSVRDGVWSFGRVREGGPFTLVHERTSNNNTALSASADSLTGFIVVGDVMFQSYWINGTTYAVTKGNDTASYTANSVYESRVFDGGDPSVYKDLVEATLSTEAMPSGGQVVLAYQVDANVGTSTWTTILTNTTANSISRTAITGLPKAYKQISFRILSTGGAEPMGYSFREEITERRYNTA